MECFLIYRNLKISRLADFNLLFLYNNHMKRILLSLGTILSIATPVVAVVSCGETEAQKNAQQYYNSKPGYSHSGGVYTGPRGGTFTITSGGHRHYSGHHGYSR